MSTTFALIVLVVVVAARLYFGRLAAQTLDAMPEIERKRILSALTAGRY